LVYFLTSNACMLHELSFCVFGMIIYVTSSCLFVLCSPDTQTYIQKLEKEKRDKAAGQTQDNRSFLAKYVSAL